MMFEQVFVKSRDRFMYGYLVDVNEDSCEVWFPYSLDLIRFLVKGAYLAVENFESVFKQNADDVLWDLLGDHYTILQLVSSKVMHYKIEALRLSPGRVKVDEEFSKFEDEWKRRIDQEESAELKIIVKSQNTGYELVLNTGGFSIKNKSSIPVQGKRVFLLNNNVVEALLNKGLEDENSIVLGKHKYYEVPVKIDYSNLIRRHFGVFATTGAGKSNLVSTLISNILSSSEDETINIIVFDINNEFTPLLIDALVLVEDVHIVFLEESLLGSELRRFLKGDLNALESASQEIVDTVIVPKNLEDTKPVLQEVIKLLLRRGCIKFYVEGTSVENLLEKLREELKAALSNINTC